MSSATADATAPVIRFSTAHLSEGERTRAVYGFYETSQARRVLLRHELEPLAGSPFHLDASLHAMAGLGVTRLACSNARLHRRPQHIVNDDVALNINLGGRLIVTQRGRECAVEEGGAALSTGAQVSMTVIERSRFLGVRVPRATLATLVRDLDDRIARPIRRDCDALRLLIGYSEVLTGTEATTGPTLCKLAAAHACDLVALALGATRDGAASAQARGARAARLDAIKADIEHNLAREDLSVATIAQRHRLPVRYVQRLFEDCGSTFTEFVLERRLACAHRMLDNPNLAHQKINFVASESGFSNLSYFNRTFRRRYGASPSDIRAQAKRDG
jgi:AraC-like DNA-binding protein